MRSNLEEFIQTSNNILLLQGPVGPFFQSFGQFLHQKHQKQIFKINLNGGDCHFYPENTQIGHVVSYAGTVEAFDAFLAQFVVQHQIDNIVCFGDTRIYHRKAKALCQASQTKMGFWVFEEGYFRPDYITFEKDGVNHYSPEPKDSAALLAIYPELGEPVPQYPVAPGFWPMAWQASRYYWYLYLNKSSYTHYHHHRSDNIYWYLRSWLSGGWIKLSTKRYERKITQQIESDALGSFFIVPLQVHMDSQIKVHSNFKSVASFLRSIIRSFAMDAPAETKLIIKHHPMDRGFIDYRRLLKKLTKHYGLEGRIIYIFNIPLPVLMRKAQGMIVVNSTSGLSAMIHRLPVKVMGKSNYDMLYMTDQQPLFSFWHHPAPPVPSVFNAFRLYHLHKTQINGSFYGRAYF